MKKLTIKVVTVALNIYDIQSNYRYEILISNYVVNDLPQFPLLFSSLPLHPPHPTPSTLPSIRRNKPIIDHRTSDGRRRMSTIAAATNRATAASEGWTMARLKDLQA